MYFLAPQNSHTHTHTHTRTRTHAHAHTRIHRLLPYLCGAVYAKSLVDYADLSPRLSSSVRL